MVGGLIKRDYSAMPAYSIVERASYSDVAASDFPELIRLHNERQSSPYHVHKYHQVPILNQQHLKYCWLFCVAGGVANRLAHQGIDPVPTLSATATAAQVKNFRNVGGYVVEGAKGIADFGIPSTDVWPQGKLQQRYLDAPQLKESSNKNKLVAFSELERMDFNALCSVLLDENNPRPVAIALPWWKHAVLALQVVQGRQRNTYGIKYANSYGKKWGSNGYGTLWGKKALAHEQIVIDTVTARDE